LKARGVEDQILSVLKDRARQQISVAVARNGDGAGYSGMQGAVIERSRKDGGADRTDADIRGADGIARGVRRHVQDLRRVEIAGPGRPVLQIMEDVGRLTCRGSAVARADLLGEGIIIRGLVVIVEVGPLSLVAVVGQIEEGQIAGGVGRVVEEHGRAAANLDRGPDAAGVCPGIVVRLDLPDALRR